jgi:hypothetical protein
MTATDTNRNPIIPKNVGEANGDPSLTARLNASNPNAKNSIESRLRVVLVIYFLTPHSHWSSFTRVFKMKNG